MTLGISIILGGFAYGCACRLARDVSELGIARGRKLMLFTLVLGIAVDLFSNSLVNLIY